MKLILKRLLSYFPSKLPVGMSQFEAFSDSIIELSGPYADNDSLKFAIASMIIHTDAKRGSVPKNEFVVKLRKSAANQVASQVFQDIKKRQEDLQKAAQLAAATEKPVEAATTETTTPNGETTNEL